MEPKMYLTSAAGAEAAPAPEIRGFTDDPTRLEAAMPEFDSGGITAGSVDAVVGHTEPGDRGRVLLYPRSATGDWFGLQLVLDGSEAGRHAYKGDLGDMTLAGCIGVGW
jgi:hypothetical protein